MPGHTRDTRDGILYCTVTVPVIHRQSFHFDTTGKVFISTPEDTGPARFHFDTRGHRTGACVHTQMQIQTRSRAAHLQKHSANMMKDKYVGARRQPPIRFFMYEGPELDHGYLRLCPGFELMQQSAYNERLGEAYLRDALAIHPWRTHSPSEATLFFVPIWEVVSFNLDRCNGTTHRQRMARAAAALRSSPSYRKPRRANQPHGYDHLIASTGCIERGERIAERLTNALSKLLTASIVGRDRACAIDRWRTRTPLLCTCACPARAHVLLLVPLFVVLSARALELADSSFYAANAVGRCTVELPYVSNPHGQQARRLLARPSAAGSTAKSGIGESSRAGSSSSSSSSSGGGGGGGTSNGEGVGVGSVHGGRRPWLLSFTGSLDVCCEPGKSIRRAMRELVGASPNDTSVRHVARGLSSSRSMPGSTPAEEKELYRTAGEQLASSRFCLVPAGDNEVSSRLYSAMAAGCVPVVIANQLAGAFASRVPYSRFWVRVEQQTFINNPLALLNRLRAISQAEIADRRARMLRHVADVTYDQQLTAAVTAAAAARAAAAAAEPDMAVSRSRRPAGGTAHKSVAVGSTRDLLHTLAHLRNEGAVTSLEYASRRASVLEAFVGARRLSETDAVTPSVTSSAAYPLTPLTAPGRGTSRLATNLLRSADEACMRGAETSQLGNYPLRHPYAGDDKWGLNCSCLLTPPKFFWCAGHACTGPKARTQLWTRGRVPTETCRCLHCATLCPTEEETISIVESKQAKGGKGLRG